MSRFWSDNVAELRPYVPGLQALSPEVIKLNTNESPFGPSPRAIAAIRHAAEGGLNLYPDPDSRDLKAAIAAYHRVSVDEVYVGNGSDEVLAHIFVGLLKHREPVLFPDVTYGFYQVYCRFFGIAFEAPPLDDGMSIRLVDFHRPQSPVIFPNPNAPTGRAVSRREIGELLRGQRDRVVVVDEAYVDYGAETVVPLIAEHPNLIVVRTMSKSRGLAGLRVGYALGDRQLIEALRRVKDSLNSYPVGRLAQAGAAASLADDGHFRETVARVVASRQGLDRQLTELGFDVVPSAANFVFAAHPDIGGAELAEALRRRGILVRHFDAPRTRRHVRITVGTEAQLAQLRLELGRIVVEARSA